jgi:uncharacterized protein (DUF4213/DUF364 family)
MTHVSSFIKGVIATMNQLSQYTIKLNKSNYVDVWIIQPMMDNAGPDEKLVRDFAEQLRAIVLNAEMSSISIKVISDSIGLNSTYSDLMDPSGNHIENRSFMIEITDTIQR